MGTRLASRIGLLVFPLLVVCLLVIGVGTAPASNWQGVLSIWPGGRPGDDYYPGQDLNYVTFTGGHAGCSTRWPATDPSPNLSHHYQLVDEWDGSTTTDYICTQSAGQNNPVSDAYVAQHSGAWEEDPNENYRRNFVLWAKYPCTTGYGDVTVEVWRLDKGLPPSYCVLAEYPQNGNLMDFATLVETWDAGVEESYIWAGFGYTRSGPGDEDPVGEDGTVLRITGEVVNQSRMGVVYVDEFRVLYQKYVE